MVLNIFLTPKQQEELNDILLNDAKPYMRERAGAILKLHAGMSGVEIAASGLLRRRRKNTVYEWIHRYNIEGINGLVIKNGRGCKSSFFPPQPGTGGTKTASNH